MRTAKTLIRLGGCPGWSESSLGAQSLCWFCHVAAHMVNEHFLSCASSFYYRTVKTMPKAQHKVEIIVLTTFLSHPRKLYASGTQWGWRTNEILIISTYRKNHKISDTRKFAVITLKVEQDGNVSKRCRGNCKQCRPWSDCSCRSSLIWVCTVCQDMSVRKLRKITVHILWNKQ